MDPIQNQNGAVAPEKKSYGAIIGIVVIVIILIVGAFYIWGGKTSSDEVEVIETELQAGAGADVEVPANAAELE